MNIGKLRASGLILGAIATAVVVVTGLRLQSEPVTPSVANQPVVAELAKVEVPSSSSQIKLSFAPVVRAAAPAVVNVYVRQRVKRFSSPLMNDPFFRRFFGQRLNRKRSRMQNSLGSGVILRPNGLVVTNYHVIKGGDSGEIKIALQDKREYSATIMLTDEQTDLAVLKIDNPGKLKFPYLKLEDSDGLNVGDLVLAIGNPFGVGQTVTSGIVSALARTKVGAADYQSFIQTDAAINPGNSGGALVDLSGRLVGINTAIYSRSGGSNGIGFAIPSNMVQLIVNSALEGKTVKRPWFGARLQAVTSDIANSLGLDRPSGALITSIHDASPAQLADLKSGDVITKVGDHPVADPRSFHYRFATMGIGGSARITIVRRGKIIQKDVSLIAAPLTPAPKDRRLKGNTPLSGAHVANLSPGLAEQIDAEEVEGVVILDVAPGSFAASVGFRANDKLVSLNNTPILSVDELLAHVRIKHRVWRIEIKRGKRILRLVLPGGY